MMHAAFRGFPALPLGAAWYETLGVARDASEAEIKTAFREKARSVHPDVGGNDNAFVKLNQAYEEGLRGLK